MSDLPLCPRCETPIQPDWDWCHACGYDPLGKRTDGQGGDDRRAGASADTASEAPAVPAPPPPARLSGGPEGPDGLGAIDRPRPRNVYDPDRPTSPVVLGVVGMAGVVVVALLGWALLRQPDGPGDPPNPFVPGGEVDFERGIERLDDGWYRIAVDDGAVTVELPGALLRSRDELMVGELGQLAMAVWGGGEADRELYGVGVAELDGDLRSNTDRLLDEMPLPVELEVYESSRRRIEVGGHPAVEVRAEGPDGALWGLVIAADDRLVTIVYGSARPGEVDERRARIESSVRLA